MRSGELRGESARKSVSTLIACSLESFSGLVLPRSTWRNAAACADRARTSGACELQSSPCLSVSLLLMRCETHSQTTNDPSACSLSLTSTHTSLSDVSALDAMELRVVLLEPVGEEGKPLVPSRLARERERTEQEPLELASLARLLWVLSVSPAVARHGDETRRLVYEVQARRASHAATHSRKLE